MLITMEGEKNPDSLFPLKVAKFFKCKVERRAQCVCRGSSRYKSQPESSRQLSLGRCGRKPPLQKAGGKVAVDGADVFVLAWAGSWDCSVGKGDCLGSQNDHAQGIFLSFPFSLFVKIQIYIRK